VGTYERTQSVYWHGKHVRFRGGQCRICVAAGTQSKREGLVISTRNLKGWGAEFMKIKPVLKYYWRDYRNVLLIMYLVVYAFAIMLLVGTSKVANSSCGGLEFISIITVFVLGLSSFKQYFKLCSANGISRKTLLCSIITAFGIITVVMSLIDTLNTLLFSQFANYQSMFRQNYYPIRIHTMFDANVEDLYSGFHYTFPMLLQQFLWLIFAYFWIAMVGLFITALYYRMNKGLKIAVSVSVPVLWLFVLPSLDKYLWGNQLSHTIQTFFNFVWGYSNGYNPFIGMASMFVFAAVNAAFAWLLVRRASVKE
jgi:hypothetical protein